MFHRPPRPEDNVHCIICGKCIKVILKIKLLGLAHRTSLVSPCLSFSLSLPLTLFLRLISWSIEALCDQLSARVSKTWMERHSASSLTRETGREPVATVNRANFLSRSFIGSLCKPRDISLFLSSIFLSTTFFPYISLNQSPTPSPLRITLDPPGLDPGTLWPTS